MSNSTRSTNSYDERYVVPLEASRRGAHRARSSPVMAALPVIAVIGVVVGAITLVYVVFGGLGGGAGTAQSTAAPTTTGAAASPTASSPVASASPTASQVAPAGTVDKTIQLSVFNGTHVSGLARKAGDKLALAGWTAGPAQTWTGAAVSVTTVFIGTEDQRASAQSIVKTLGHGIVRLSPTSAGNGIAVVVGPDYPGAGGMSSSTTRAHSTSSTTKTSATRTSSSTSKTDSPTSTSSPAGN